MARRRGARSAPRHPTILAFPPLLANRDPGRFDALYDALEPATRALVEELSPLLASATSRPVELASDPDDTFFPVDESALAEARV